MTTRFFVSGAMTEGLVHWSKISAMIESSQPAYVRGAAWRLKVGFPVLLKDGEQLISGQLVTLKPSELLVNLLDEFHGVHPMDPTAGLFQREQTNVHLEGSGEVEQAWVYFLNPQKLPTTAQKIADGDWKKSVQENPPLTVTLTERQKTYLRSLGAATGRQIVPINDLSLYRELMNLELIVDKGRRLALSPFGQEVVRYLG